MFDPNAVPFKASVPSPKSLEFRLAAARSVGVFQGASEAPISVSYGPSESGGRRTEKQPTGRGPEGCVENGSAASGGRRISHVST
jgi:hypothetical protein